MLIDIRIPAKSSADRRKRLKQLLHALIKPAIHDIIAVKDVNETPARAFETRLKIPQASNILGLPEVLNPPLPYLTHDRAYVCVIASIVHHFDLRSEEHTSELQSLMRTSYAVLCLTKKNHMTH